MPGATDDSVLLLSGCDWLTLFSVAPEPRCGQRPARYPQRWRCATNPPLRSRRLSLPRSARRCPPRRRHPAAGEHPSRVDHWGYLHDCASSIIITTMRGTDGYRWAVGSINFSVCDSQASPSVRSSPNSLHSPSDAPGQNGCLWAGGIPIATLISRSMP